MASIHVPALNLFVALKQGYSAFEIAVALQAPYETVKQLIAANDYCFQQQTEAMSVRGHTETFRGCEV
jgi:hypothetical protein